MRRALAGVGAAVLLTGLAGAVVVGMQTDRIVLGPQRVEAPKPSAVGPQLLGELAQQRARTGAAFPSARRAQAPATIWAVGDGATGTDEGRRVAQRIAAARPQRVLYLGDVYQDGTADEFREHFAGVYGGLAPIIAPTPGNHDWPNRATGYDPYWQSVTGRPTPHHYAFSIGGWRVVSLNSEEPSDAAQLRFLRRELRRAGPGQQCVLAMLHRPRENAGSHGDNADLQPLWRELRGRAALVLAGHDHNLQRLRPVAGTTQLVIGAGGRRRYGLEADPRLRFGRDDVDGALRLQLRRGGASLAIVTADGEILDRSRVACGG